MKYSLLAAVVLASVMVGTVAARADDWRVVSASRDQVSFIDASTIQTDGQRKLYWFLNLYRVTDDGADYYMNHVAIDCQQRTSELLVEIVYLANGAVVSHSGDISGAPQPIPPSSVGGATHNAVCAGQWPSTTAFASVRDLIAQARPAMERMPVR